MIKKHGRESLWQLHLGHPQTKTLVLYIHSHSKGKEIKEWSMCIETQVIEYFSVCVRDAKGWKISRKLPWQFRMGIFLSFFFFFFVIKLSEVSKNDWNNIIECKFNYVP